MQRLILNKPILREHYIIPTYEGKTIELQNSKYFSILEAKNEFWNIQLGKKIS